MGSAGGTVKEPKKKKKKRKISGSSALNILLVSVLIVGLGIMLYPTVSDYWNSFHQTKAIAGYQETVSGMSEADYEAFFDEAREYNTHLAALPSPFGGYEKLSEEYYSTLDVTGTGIMGYVSIASIDVELPIYHGTSSEVLNTAAGHLEGSSLPIGEEGDHAVISAHRGLPSAKLFTYLDKLEEGDVFTLTVLNRLMTYQVDQILIVEPSEIGALIPEAGKDYVTLQTCTPYGINTHRLLVRGHRIENEAVAVSVRAEAKKIPTYLVMPLIAMPMLLVLLAILLIQSSRKHPKVSWEEVAGLDAPIENDENKEEKE